MLFAGWVACAPGRPPNEEPLRFEGSPALGSFRLVSLEPRVYPLHGGRGTLRYEGVPPLLDGGAYGTFLPLGVEGAAPYPTGFLDTTIRDGGALEFFVPASLGVRTADILVFSNTSVLDAGVWGRLNSAIEYIETPAKLELEVVLDFGQRGFSGPFREGLGGGCATIRASNLGDVAVAPFALSVSGLGFRLDPSTDSCPSRLVFGGPCTRTLCFDANPVGTYTAMVRGGDATTRAELQVTATVLPPFDGLSWMRPFNGGPLTPFAKGVLTRPNGWAPDGGLLEYRLVPPGESPHFVHSLAPDRNDGFVALVETTSSLVPQAFSVMHVDGSGQVASRVAITGPDFWRSRGVWMLSADTVAVGAGNELVGYSFASGGRSASWIPSALPSLGPVGVVDRRGHLFLSLPQGLTELGPTGALVALHGPAGPTLAVDLNGDVLFSRGTFVAFVRSGVLQDGFDTQGEIRGLGVDDQGRVVVAHLSSVERWTTAGVRQDTWAFDSVESLACIPSGVCFVAARQSGSAFIGRLQP